MSDQACDLWADDPSVFFTSLWNWSPATWAAIGWTGPRGEARRETILSTTTDPFVSVVYITGGTDPIDPKIKGRLAGFYLVSHEAGDRDSFTSPVHHDLAPKQWRHSLRAVRAFSFLPEYRPLGKDFEPAVSTSGMDIGSRGKIIQDADQLELLRNLPCIEVDVYGGVSNPSSPGDWHHRSGATPAGPASSSGYVVEQGTARLPRQLYLLRLDGDLSAFLGREVEGRIVCKIGLSVSPELRRQHFQKALPRGAFHWQVDRVSHGPGEGVSFDVAVQAEDEMKRLLSQHAEWLGGEFYLASQEVFDESWLLGLQAAGIKPA